MHTSIAWIDDVKMITIKCKKGFSKDPFKNKEQPIIFWSRKDKVFLTEIVEKSDEHSIRIRIFEALPMGEELILRWGKIEIPVYPGAIVRTTWFDDHYADINTNLGAIYDQAATTFTVWAPTATSVDLYLDNKSIKLIRKERGIWQKTVIGDWHGIAYDYEVIVNGQASRVNDPYAKAMLANSEKGVVIDLTKTDPLHFRHTEKPTINNLQDAIIYELHVRDATIQQESGVNNRGKFLGLTEQATTTDGKMSSALSYVKKLGVTHVQFLPINDFARVNEINPSGDYNWGYDPLYFQVPEGSYSTSPEDPGARIKECKQMIHSFHQAGISVILDVVYNHVFIMKESSFELLVPGYYFRYYMDGTLSNGTGVGNDFATERLMARKFILDTIDFWLSEYRIDGFRFDLMGAMDINTMADIQKRCHQEPVPIMLLGEGWDLQTALHDEMKATSRNSSHLQGIRFFNDFFRDTVKGNLFQLGDTGYINGNGHFNERMASLISGSALAEFGNSFVANVDQTINFVECHDNYTLWDQLKFTNQNDSEFIRQKMHQLATGITLLSQGVPFIHAGQEWFQTKQGNGNSYISGDEINQLDWNERDKQLDNILFVQTLIALRKKYDVFRLTSKQAIKDRFHVLTTPAPVFGFTLLGSNEDFAIYINPTNEAQDIHLPSSGRWEIAVTNDHTNMKDIIGEYTKLAAYELIVLQK